MSDVDGFEVGVGTARLQFSAPWPPGMPAEYMVVNLRAEGLNAGDQVAVDPAWSPAVFLRDLGASSRAWDGPRSWDAPGGNLALVALHDGVGRVHIQVTLGMYNGDQPTADGDWRATGVVELELGALSRIATELAEFLGHQ